MFSHVTLGTNNLHKSCKFYDAVLAEINLVRREVLPDGGPNAACWVSPAHTVPRFYLYEPFDGNSASFGNGTMVAFHAQTVEQVRIAHRVGLLHGGSCEGPPGPRPRYGDGYFGAYLRDPDGNKIHLVYRGDIVLTTSR